jgi:hypothetical protein
MGLSISIYRWGLGDCTNGGESAEVESVCVVNVPGPFEPRGNQPAFKLVKGPGGRGHAILHPVEEKKAGMVGPMFGGNFGYSSDSRWSEAVREITGSPHYGAVAIHDRYETPEDHAALCG